MYNKSPHKYIAEEYLHPPHSACPGCALPLAMRYILKGLGGKVILLIPPGCSVVVAAYPNRVLKYNGEYIPVMASPLGSTPALAAGLKTALVSRGDRDTCVVAYTGDGATYDIGIGTLSAAAERNEDIIYICSDNELYGNTGGQRSSATPWGVRTPTSPSPRFKAEHKKDIISVMAAHSIPYIATATIAYPDDLIRKVRRAREISGFRFIHLFVPCVAGWFFRSELTVTISRLAVQTRVFPLLEVENGTGYTLNIMPDGTPVEEYIKLQGRYSHFTPEKIDTFQGIVDERWCRLQRKIKYSSNDI